MSATITIYRTRFTEDEISVYDENGDVMEYGDIPYDDDHTDTFNHYWGADCGPRVDWAVEEIRRRGLSFDASGSDWACDPDGSRIIDYMEGEREEVSAHLSGFAPTEVRAIMERVG